MAARSNNLIIFSWLDWVAWIIVIIGSLNWGLVGALEFNLIGAIFGGSSSVGARITYIIVGFAGLWSVYTFWKVYEIHSQRVQVKEIEEEERRAA